MSIDVVTQFIRAWSALDLDYIEHAVSADVFYQNIPFAAVEQTGELAAFGDSVARMVQAGGDGMPITPIIGRAAFSRFLDSIKVFDWADWQIRSIAADGRTVFTDRIDRFGFDAGGSITVHVIGVFEVTDGLISAWRDYFSLHEFQSQIP